MADQPDVTTRHPEYLEYEPQWKRCRDFASGSDAVKKVDAYLPQPAGMDDGEYRFYKERALYYNATSRTRDALTGLVFRQPPTLEKVPEPIEKDLEDATLRDEPFEAVAKRVINEVIEVGRYCLLVEMPVAPATVGEQAGNLARSAILEASGRRPATPRPYLVTIPAERVINWKTAQVGSDPEQLVLVVIEENVETDPSNSFSHETECQYRELALVDGVYRQRIWRKSKDSTKDKDVFVVVAEIWPTRRNERMTFIPFTFIGTTGVTPEVSKPPLIDLVDVSLSHYRNSADLEYGLYYTAVPTPWASGVPDSTILKVGASVAWNLGEGGRAGMVEFTGKGLGAIKESMASKERMMATLGARLLEDPTANSAETATAVRMRSSGETASLGTISFAGGAGLARAVRWMMWWAEGMGELSTDALVKLTSEFFQINASPEEVKAAVLSWQAGAISFETLYERLQKGGWTRDGVTAEEEKAQIEKETPLPVDEPEDPDSPDGDPDDDDPANPQPKPPARPTEELPAAA
jgi:hypothetical protein